MKESGLNSLRARRIAYSLVLLFGVCALPAPNLAGGREIPLALVVWNTLGAFPRTLRVDSWDLTLVSSTTAQDRIKMAGEFNGPAGGVNLLADGARFEFGPGPLIETLPAGSFALVRGSQYSYVNGKEKGSFLLDIGGSSRSKFSLQMESEYGALQGVSPTLIRMTSGTFNDSVLVANAFKGTAGVQGSLFILKRGDDYASSEWFIDSLLVTHYTTKTDSDSARATSRFPGGPDLDFANDAFTLDMGWDTFTVPPGSWTIKGMTGTWTGTEGGKSKITIKVDNAKRTVSLQCTGMNISGATQNAIISMAFGPLVWHNYLNLQPPPATGKEQFIY